MNAVTGFLPTFRDDGVAAVIAHLAVLRGMRLNGKTLTEAELTELQEIGKRFCQPVIRNVSEQQGAADTEQGEMAGAA